MPVYLVDRSLPGISMEELAAAQRSAIAATDGTDVTYLRSVFVPGESHCMCLFDGPDADAVVAVNESAGLPYRQVIEALDLPR